VRFYSFAFVYPAVMVGGMALLSTRSWRLGLAFGVATWAIAYVFVRRENRTDDGGESDRLRGRPGRTGGAGQGGDGQGDSIAGARLQRDM
jgi:hypothetical protein